MSEFIHKGQKKKEYVQKMFNNISERYDILNTILSFGLDAYWRRKLIDEMNPTNNISILDVATGTGNIVFQIAKKYNTQIVGLDYAEGMIAKANKKALHKNLTDKVTFILGDAENLPFDDNSFDCLSISFGFRNMGNYETALSEFYRVLKQNGKLTILEFSEPKTKIFINIYKFYFKHILPKVGLLFSKSDGYKYLPESVEYFPSRVKVCDMINNAGFINQKCIDLTFGICSIFFGYKNGHK